MTVRDASSAIASGVRHSTPQRRVRQSQQHFKFKGVQLGMH